MTRGDKPETMWGLGLSETEIDRIEDAVGAGFRLANHTPTDPVSTGSGFDGRAPATAWIPWRTWSALPAGRRESFKELEQTQRILIQDETDEPLELEYVLEQGFLTVIRHPLTRTKVQDALFRAKEVTSLYSDIYRMTEEILLERELLERKTDQLLFLNKLLTGATESLDTVTILQSAKQNLEMLLPVRDLHAVFWQRSPETGESDVEILLSTAMDQTTERKWVDHLLDQVIAAGGGPVAGFEVGPISPERDDFAQEPGAAKNVNLTLRTGQHVFGQIVLACDPSMRMAKDQAQTLRSAVSHLSLALNNALLYTQVKVRADHDALTKVYNRHTFEERLVCEMRRSQRYKTDLSLLMIDLDHFKHVNDRYGHLAGDDVLRALGTILHDNLRATDLAARYGGEEFTVLLPHTNEADAWRLAERIRDAVAQTSFQSPNGEFKVTASIGVSSLNAGSLDKERDLVLSADQALYLAKANGRNTVMSSTGKQTEAVRQ